MRIVNKALNKIGNSIPLFQLRNDYVDYYPSGAQWRFERVEKNLRGISPSNLTEIEFLYFIHIEFKRILQATPSKLQEYVDYVDRRFPDLLYSHRFERQTDFGKKIEDAFEYGSFRKSLKARWFAKTLGVKTCLYCNSQFTLQISKNSSSGILFQFDHYFSKTRYPFLSVSMCNLIPTCSNCNIAKSKKHFTIRNAIHPYHEDMNSFLEFNVSNPDVLDFIINHNLGKKISVLLIGKISKVQNHITTFSLDKIVNEHSDFVEELFLKAYHYDESMQREIINDFDGIIDSDTIKRFILGNYYLDEDLNKRPLAKMTKDIARQIKLI
jgi:hypothetical protein